jgi:hypothetical protein
MQLFGNFKFRAWFFFARISLVFDAIDHRHNHFGRGTIDDLRRRNGRSDQLLNGKPNVAVRALGNVGHVSRHRHAHQSVAGNAIAQNHRTIGFGASHV